MNLMIWLIACADASSPHTDPTRREGTPSKGRLLSAHGRDDSSFHGAAAGATAQLSATAAGARDNS
jgi:hypothetical protein